MSLLIKISNGAKSLASTLDKPESQSTIGATLNDNAM